MGDLWSMIVPNQSAVEKPLDYYWSEWGSLFSSDMTDSFTTKGDEMPEGRLKLAHTQGVIAQVKWTPIRGTGYSGIQDGGSKHVIMRLSETGMLHKNSKGLKPSVAFKFLRDGKDSSNIVAMPSFHGSDNWNFLKEPMLTRVKPFEAGTCEALTIEKKLLEG